MSIVAFSGFTFAPPVDVSSGVPTISTIILNGAADKCAVVFQVPKTGTLDWFEFLLAAVTNNPDNGLRLSFQTVDVATGLPDGTQDQFFDATGALSAGWFVPSQVLTHDGSGGGTKRSVTRGELIACVIEFVSFVASDQVSVGLVGRARALNQPYVVDGSSGSYSIQSLLTPNFVLKYSDGTYGELPWPAMPVSAFNTRTFNSGSTPDERGLLFQVPAPCRVSGAWLRGDFDGDFDLVLYDAADSVVASVSVDKDVRSAANGQSSEHLFSSSVTLTANVNYRLVVKPTSVTNLSFYDSTVPSALLGVIAGGSTWMGTSRTDAGAWTDANTIRPWIGPLFDGIDNGAGSGGGASAHASFG